MNTHLFNVRGAIICYQYSERVKSELIIAHKLLAGLNGLRGDFLSGAERMVLRYLDALMGEAEIAYGATKLRGFREASLRISEAIGRVSLHDRSGANKCLSEAVSQVTDCGRKAFQFLREEGLL
ncbi:MAG: hypothetical protein ACE5Z5_05110 [Candidatus Bathyarchaeia archaeon]